MVFLQCSDSLAFSVNSSLWNILQFLFTALSMISAAAKSLQLCLTLCDPIGGSPPGSAVPGILQARTLEWAAMSFSNAWKWKVKVKSPSRVHLSATPWTTAYQAPLPMGILQPTGVGCHCFLPAWLLLIPKYSVTQEQRTCLQKVTKCLPFLILAIIVLSCQVLKHGVIKTILLIVNLYWTLTMCQELDWVQHTL